MNCGSPFSEVSSNQGECIGWQAIQLYYRILCNMSVDVKIKINSSDLGEIPRLGILKLSRERDSQTLENETLMKYAMN